MVITRSGLTIEMRHASVIDGHEIVETYIEDGQPLTVKETPRVEIETKAVITSRWELSKDGSTPKSEVSTYWYSHNYVYDKQ